MSAVDDYLERHQERFLDELKDFLRIPSVSADSRRAPDVRRAADFVADRLRDAGLTAELVCTDGQPLVYAEWLGAPGAPTLLVYGHYDVQPPEPLDLWISEPFEPTIRGGNLYARGATDDKGQMYTHVKAVEAWLQAEGKLPINVKFLIEGEEEVGSHAIVPYVREHRDRLACQYVVISDTCMFGPDQPAITNGLRGLAYFEVRLQGPGRDLHSGSFGGSVRNPANALCSMLASLIDENGRVTIEGFYDDVVELTAAEREQIRSLPFDQADYCEEVGVRELFGEAGYSTLERRWTRPTCDVHGLFGGYQGEGAKTVLPAKAGAKVSFRLVPNQDPMKIAKAFLAHLEEVRPTGVNMEFINHSGGEAIVVPTDTPGVRAAARALESAFGKKPFFIREGGSIPIVSTFKKLLGVDSLLLGYGLSDDNTHAPNEKFRVKDFYRGIRANARLFEELTKVG